MSTPTPPYGDAARVETLAGVDNATALMLLDTACWIIDSYVSPGTIPSPVPMRVDTAATLLAVRLNTAGTGPQVVSESMGSYSYRLAVSAAADELAATFPADLAGMLAPWAPLGAGTTGTLNTGPPGGAWPVDWWQRNYDDPATWSHGPPAGSAEAVKR